MFKKISAFLLALLLCVALLPSNARAADQPDPPPQPTQVEPAETEPPVMPAWAEEPPNQDIEKHIS